MAGSEEVTFAQMASEFPVRTGLFTLGPIAFALVQLLNSYAHGVSLLYTGGFAVLLLAFSVQINRYHLAAFRRTVVSGEWGIGK